MDTSHIIAHLIYKFFSIFRKEIKRSPARVTLNPNVRERGLTMIVIENKTSQTELIPVLSRMKIEKNGIKITYVDDRGSLPLPQTLHHKPILMRKIHLQSENFLNFIFPMQFFKPNIVRNQEYIYRSQFWQATENGEAAIDHKFVLDGTSHLAFTVQPKSKLVICIHEETTTTREEFEKSIVPYNTVRRDMPILIENPSEERVTVRLFDPSDAEGTLFYPAKISMLYGSYAYVQANNISYGFGKFHGFKAWSDNKKQLFNGLVSKEYPEGFPSNYGATPGENLKNVNEVHDNFEYDTYRNPMEIIIEPKTNVLYLFTGQKK